MKIACSTSAFKTDLAEALSRVSALGFEYVDLICIKGWDHVNPTELAADFDDYASNVARLLDQHKLMPVAMNCGVPTLHADPDPKTDAQRDREIDALTRLAAKFDVNTIGFYPGYRHDDQEAGPMIDRLAANTRRLREVAGAHGVTAFVEPHVRTPLDTLEMTKRYLDADEGAMVTFDPTHFVSAGESLDAAADVMVARAQHCHVRGCTSDLLQAPPADSTLDLDRLFERLHEANYPGNISIEYLPGYEKSFGHPVEEAIATLKQQLDTRNK